MHTRACNYGNCGRSLDWRGAARISIPSCRVPPNNDLHSKTPTLDSRNTPDRQFLTSIRLHDWWSRLCIPYSGTSWELLREMKCLINPLSPELNPICYLLALLGAHHFLHVSRIRVKSLTFRRLMSYIYGAPILDVSRSHTTTQHSR